MVPVDSGEPDLLPVSFWPFPSPSLPTELVSFEGGGDEMGVVAGNELSCLLTTEKLCETASWMTNAKHSSAHRRAAFGSMVKLR